MHKKCLVQENDKQKYKCPTHYKSKLSDLTTPEAVKPNQEKNLPKEKDDSENLAKKRGSSSQQQSKNKDSQPSPAKKKCSKASSKKLSKNIFPCAICGDKFKDINNYSDHVVKCAKQHQNT